METRGVALDMVSLSLAHGTRGCHIEKTQGLPAPGLGWLYAESPLYRHAIPAVKYAKEPIDNFESQADPFGFWHFCYEDSLG